MPISTELVYLRDFAEAAEKLRANYGHTNKFSTGIQRLDAYLGGGYGRHDGYEIVVLFGPTGVGKSMVGLNLIADPVIKGHKVGLLVLEDDGPDVFIRFSDILGDKENKLIMESKNILCLPPEALMKSWNLDDLLKYIEDWFTTQGVDIILLDHLQFAFEGAESIKSENEYTAQRVFMQKLNQLMKRVKKTIIIVSHVNKDGQSKGMNKIVGSGAIAQAATKTIEVRRDDSGQTLIQMWKSRFTKTPVTEATFVLQGSVLKDHLANGGQYLSKPSGVITNGTN